MKNIDILKFNVTASETTADDDIQALQHIIDQPKVQTRLEKAVREALQNEGHIPGMQVKLERGQ